MLDAVCSVVMRESTNVKIELVKVLSSSHLEFDSVTCAACDTPNEDPVEPTALGIGA